RQPMTSRYTLRPGDKIIFFTDGLTEATPAVDDFNENERIMFEHANLEQVLASHANSSAQQLVSALSAELIKYRGNEKFEDDVCIICLEY
ncbi:MAG: SpoIIE family protein phosphatase, partial [Leptospiraceae bacterium]|nr:SpoIIE family protein phosphatase [Leptospiraceae bacterium]